MCVSVRVRVFVCLCLYLSLWVAARGSVSFLGLSLSWVGPFGQTQVGPCLPSVCRCWSVPVFDVACARSRWLSPWSLSPSPPAPHAGLGRNPIAAFQGTGRSLRLNSLSLSLSRSLARSLARARSLSLSLPPSRTRSLHLSLPLSLRVKRKKRKREKKG